MTSFSFFVIGTPKPAGSKTGFALKKGGQFTGRVVITDACKNSREWKTSVTLQARESIGVAEPISGPVKLTCQFHVMRPKCHFRAGDQSKGLKPNSPWRPLTKPDLLKLTRAVEDALIGITYFDDAQIVKEDLEKVYALSPGCHITVEQYGVKATESPNAKVAQQECELAL